MTTPTTPAALTVAAALNDHPDGITTRALSDACGVSASTVAKTLTAMEADGTATRTPGPANGNRKTADIWHPATTTEADTTPADNATADEPTAEDATSEPTATDATASEPTAGDATTADTAVDNEPTPDAAPAEEATADTPADEPTGKDAPAADATADELPAADATANEPATDATSDDATTADTAVDDESTLDAAPAEDATADTPADEPTGKDAPEGESTAAATAGEPATDTTPDDTAAQVAPVSGAPVGPRQPDLKVLIMAGVLGGHPEGITADAAINESGLSVAMGDTILAAMEVSGAARRLPTEADGTELWVPVADADLAKVDPANAPTHTTCPTCGHTRKIRRPSARRAAATTGTGRATGEINTDGSAKLAKNGLRNHVEAFMRDLGTGHDVTPGTVARELGGRSSGAVLNAMGRLTEPGVLVMTSEAPVKYALAETAPAPTAEVLAFMTRPLTEGEPTSTDPATTDTDPATTDTAPATTDTAPATTGDAATDTDAEVTGDAATTGDDTTEAADQPATTGDDENGTPATDEADAAPIAA